MRNLLLFRGSPGCGKSTFIEKHGLKQYTLSADEIRLLHQAPCLEVDGNYGISQMNDGSVWKILFQLLEERMKRGEFIVIDACNSRNCEMTRYRKLAEQYRYRITMIDMTDIPIEVVKKRNSQRKPDYKIVPEHVIDKHYKRFETENFCGGIKIIKPYEFEETVKYTATDFSEYEKIHIIGDIHGCYTALKTYFKDGLNPKHKYIFIGDYIDRGIENVEVLNFLFDIMNYKNVTLLTGNHEIHLKNYGENKSTKSKQFNKYTMRELDEANISKKDVRQLCRKLAQICYFTYGDKTVLVSHGGISALPANIELLATDQFIKGVGYYEDMELVNDSFRKDVEKQGINAYQVHGHRNTDERDVQVNDRCFCLEGQVEMGGSLRVLTLDKEKGFTPIEIKNDVFKLYDTVPKNIDLTNEEVIEMLRNNHYIRESKNDGNISAFNFTTDAFTSAIWNEQTIMARGLFFNTTTNEVVCRGFNKFFNVGEVTSTRFMNLKRTMKFPCRAYVKYNGFLGLLGCDNESDEMLFCSKSKTNNEHAAMFKKIITSKLTEGKLEIMKQYVKKNQCTLLWEVIDKDNDPHIIKYNENKITLLAIVKNQINYEEVSYEEVKMLAELLGVECKEIAKEFNNFQEFSQWYEEINNRNYKYKGKDIEGFVVESLVDGFKFKVKLHYYQLWKKMRNVKDAYVKYGYYRKENTLRGYIQKNFYDFIKEFDREELKYMDIIQLRDMFLKSEICNKFYEEYDCKFIK